jgi:predicted phosphoadenosine phosphosulfate sulfurtransferase
MASPCPRQFASDGVLPAATTMTVANHALLDGARQAMENASTRCPPMASRSIPVTRRPDASRYDRTVATDSIMIRQRPLACNVHEAAMRRLDYVFGEFDQVYVSFSGGKDSGVLLNLVLAYLRAHAPRRRVGVFHLDYEAQYTATTEYVDAVLEGLGDSADDLRCCVPVKCPTSTSMHETFWRPWEPGKRDLWVRPLPARHLGPEAFDFLTPEMSDYQFQERFSLWQHRRVGARRTCVLVGIRAQESLDRWRAIVSDRHINKYKDRVWTTQAHPDVYKAYPIYDWSVEDVWTANARFGWRYNRLYDLMHHAGVPLHDMRVASPFLNAGKASLHLYRAIDPDVWGRMVSRVNGVNFTALYGNTKAMGWREITKPAHFTWQQYAMFLLDTLPAKTAQGFRDKLAISIKFWCERGGVLSENAMFDLLRAGIPFEVGATTNYKTSKLPVRMEYADDIASKDFRWIPTWKRLCVCILKNDHVGKYMGFSLNKHERSRRQTALDKYRGL